MDKNELLKLSFTQLKSELNNCNNPVREYYIRILMKQKYQAYLKQKKYNNDVKNLNIINSLVDDINKNNNKDNKQIKEYDNKNIFEEDFKSVNFKNKEVKFIPRDNLNNNLMNRLTNDISIQEFRDIRYKPKEIIHAYED